VKLLANRVQVQGEWWDEVGNGVRVVTNPDLKNPGALFVNLRLSQDPDKPRIEPIFRYPNTEHLGELLANPPTDINGVMYVAALLYGFLIFSGLLWLFILWLRRSPLAF